MSHKTTAKGKRAHVWPGGTVPTPFASRVGVEWPWRHGHRNTPLGLSSPHPHPHSLSSSSPPSVSHTLHRSPGLDEAHRRRSPGAFDTTQGPPHSTRVPARAPPPTVPSGRAASTVASPAGPRRALVGGFLFFFFFFLHFSVGMRERGQRATLRWCPHWFALFRLSWGGREKQEEEAEEEKSMQGSPPPAARGVPGATRPILWCCEWWCGGWDETLLASPSPLSASTPTKGNAETMTTPLPPKATSHHDT